MSANDHQVGGDHYKEVQWAGESIEPWDVVHIFGLGYLDGNAVRYLLRWRRKGKSGVIDLAKAAHYIEKLIEQERDNAEIKEGAQRPAHGED
jgi:hypothetical protein